VEGDGDSAVQAVHIQFLVDMLQVFAHGAGAEAERVGYFLDGIVFRQGKQHALFGAG